MGGGSGIPTLGRGLDVAHCPDRTRPFWTSPDGHGSPGHLAEGTASPEPLPARPVARLQRVEERAGERRPFAAGVRSELAQHRWIEVDDGQAANHASNTVTATVSVTPVNDPATFSGAGL